MGRCLWSRLDPNTTLHPAVVHDMEKPRVRTCKEWECDIYSFDELLCSKLLACDTGMLSATMGQFARRH